MPAMLRRLVRCSQRDDLVAGLVRRVLLDVNQSNVARSEAEWPIRLGVDCYGDKCNSQRGGVGRVLSAWIVES
jgi:hypothetical protein